MSGLQCAECGRFLGEADFAAGHVYYEPESEFGHERIEWSCRRHGIPTRAVQGIEAEIARLNADAPTRLYGGE